MEDQVVPKMKPKDLEVNINAIKINLYNINIHYRIVVKNSKWTI